MNFFRIFARFVLIAGLSGILPQGFAHAAASAAAGLRAESASAAAVLAGTIRHADGSMFTKAGARADLARAKHQRVSAALTAGICVLPPRVDGPCVRYASVSTLCASRSSATLRGPPDWL